MGNNESALPPDTEKRKAHYYNLALRLHTFRRDGRDGTLVLFRDKAAYKLRKHVDYQCTQILVGLWLLDDIWENTRHSFERVERSMTFNVLRDPSLFQLTREEEDQKVVTTTLPFGRLLQFPGRDMETYIILQNQATREARVLYRKM